MADFRGALRGALCGGAVGLANGLFGGGGGMIAVPLLSGAMNFEEKCAHATAILIIAPVCLASAAACIGMTAGGALGALFLNRLPLTAVKVIFVAVMLAAGIRMVLP